MMSQQCARFMILTVSGDGLSHPPLNLHRFVSLHTG